MNDDNNDNSSIHIPFCDLAATNAPYAAELKEAAARVIDSGRYLHGPETAALEQELAALCGTRHAVATSNGLDSIRLILRALMELGRLRPGDEVIVPGNTFIASVLPVTELGLTAVMAEPDEATMNLDMDDALRRVTPRTKAVIPVHLYGTPCNDPGFYDEMRQRGIFLLEDNAQALGASVADGRPTGGLGDASIVSFYPTKNVGGLGDGGAVMTSDPVLAQTVRTLANYGSDRRYHNLYRGYNNRMDEIQAAMLRVKLRHIGRINSRRDEVARLYSAMITNPAIRTPMLAVGDRQVWHQYVVRSKRRDALAAHLEAHGIGTNIHYAVPPHMQPCYAGSIGGGLPVTERLASEVLSLPIADVSDDTARRVAAAANSFV